MKKKTVVNRGTLSRVKCASRGQRGREINGLLVVLRSSEGRVITSHTHTVWLADEVSQRGREDSDEQEMRGAASRPEGGGLAAVWASPFGLPGSLFPDVR